jgi:hypothetical protein
MHTAIMVGAGLVTLAVFAAGAFALGKPAVAGARWFLLPWLLVALVNLYIGTMRGHTLMQELPFLAIVFGIPGVAAWIFVRLYDRTEATS